MPSRTKTKSSGVRGAGPRDPERTSASILAAAVTEFTEKGYAGARIDSIAEKSGANKRMIYHYFGDKDGLYLAVLESAYIGIRSSEAELQLANLEPVEAIEKLVAFTWDYFIEHPEFLSILATENLHRAKFLKKSKKVLQLHSPQVSMISDVLKRGVACGAFRSGVDPVYVYISIASLGIFYLSNRWTLSTIFARDLTAQDEIKAWGKHISAVILGYLRP
ncbi:TetR/AcrR family transcriptional regulator [Leptospira sp. severe_002]|uniref:TetR/AcrR family transcriptional regulator n=1 Tax=Leptospira sp. severe_002 TaxID=2838237 RepID=UPI001E31FF25|nr:TetR/AcrR family transcriptional regulator [Leptospira sp. severe_002]